MVEGEVRCSVIAEGRHGRRGDDGCSALVDPIEVAGQMARGGRGRALRSVTYNVKTAREISKRGGWPSSGPPSRRSDAT